MKEVLYGQAKENEQQGNNDAAIEYYNNALGEAQKLKNHTESTLKNTTIQACCKKLA